MSACLFVVRRQHRSDFGGCLCPIRAQSVSGNSSKGAATACFHGGTAQVCPGERARSVDGHAGAEEAATPTSADTSAEYVTPGKAHHPGPAVGALSGRGDSRLSRPVAAHA
eukprot:scaffold85949_cov69-Phaeocystis_antarctica.AAC.1